MLLHAPGTPASLIQQWVQDAYDELAGKGHWAWLREEAFLTTLAARSLSVTFGAASTAITSAALFVATDAGRQLRVSTGFVYTIDSVTDASNAVLQEAYQGSAGAATATISDIYLPMPADFRSFYDVTDFSNQRPIVWWISRDRLDVYDPARVSSDARFRVLASYKIATDTARAGRLLYEAWPHPTAAGQYRLLYFKRSDTLADTDTFKGVLATKTQAILDGALAKCAAWPGLSKQQPNPYFQISLREYHRDRFEKEAHTLDILDDDQYLESLQQVDLSKYGLGILMEDTALLRQTDATIGDYY